MMRHGSDQHLTAAMSCMIVCMLLALGALSVRSVGLAGRHGLTTPEHTEASTNATREIDDIGLRGSLP
jgi:hypothetical protein